MRARVSQWIWHKFARSSRAAPTRAPLQWRSGRRQASGRARARSWRQPGAAPTSFRPSDGPHTRTSAAGNQAQPDKRIRAPILATDWGRPAHPFTADWARRAAAGGAQTVSRRRRTHKRERAPADKKRPTRNTGQAGRRVLARPAGARSVSAASRGAPTRGARPRPAERPPANWARHASRRAPGRQTQGRPKGRPVGAWRAGAWPRHWRRATGTLSQSGPHNWGRAARRRWPIWWPIGARPPVLNQNGGRARPSAKNKEHTGWPNLAQAREPQPGRVYPLSLMIDILQRITRPGPAGRAAKKGRRGMRGRG